MPTITVVFVHGWSVTKLNTYGNLPERLQIEGAKIGINIRVEEIFLSRYISFHDEIKLPDISRALDTAISDQLVNVLTFVCITHSTGGPVVRDWWNRYCKGKQRGCRMTHLIMLAPANFGSALAKLGKGTISRLKSWWNGIEPGQGVLDWLELGSAESWDLNMDWISSDGSQISQSGFFPFVLTGQSIDREFYDALNSYTGETGSDGVVRVAAANMNATYIRLEQPVPQRGENGEFFTNDLDLTKVVTAPLTPIRIISGKSHSGETMGIMLSVGIDDEKSMETVNAIFDCVKVVTREDYETVITKFENETTNVEIKGKVEIENRWLLSDRYFIHDRYTMVIFRVIDSKGYPVNDYDLLLTAGENSDPNHLPEGFFIDRQQNGNNINTITYFIDYDIMNGDNKVVKDNRILREKVPGINKLGLKISARPRVGFVRYIECKYEASKDLFEHVLKPNATTLVDIVLQRVVDKEVFRFESLTTEKDFHDIEPSGDVVE
jgi:hypothetical protein